MQTDRDSDMLKEGYIEKIIFQSDKTGYAVLSVNMEGSYETFVGTLFAPATGMYIKAEGEYKKNPNHGEQFCFFTCEVKVPNETENIKKYLASGIIKGIGEILAERIVEMFGDDTLRIIDKEPERLSEVKGISESKAREIGESYSENKEYREAVMFLGSFDISPTLAMKIYRTFGNDTYRIIKSNPYKLALRVHGIGFKLADKIAMKVGISKDSEERKKAAIIYTLYEAEANGHMYLPKDVLTETVRKTLGLGNNDETCYDLIEEKRITAFGEDMKHILSDMAFNSAIIIKYAIRRRDGSYSVTSHVPDRENGEEMSQVIYLPANHSIEEESAVRLLRLNTVETEDTEHMLDTVESSMNICLEDNQKEAVRKALTSGVAVITGGPGTGKTTIIRAIIECFHKKGKKVEICAPTGRAAKRITESTGYKASTIHRLLEFSGVPDEDGGTYLEFGRNTDKPLECGAVIVDEMSMVDSFIFGALLKAVGNGTRLILVGDADQLPSVGAGNVLHDIIASGVFEVVELKKIFRQGEKSKIVENAHKIKEGTHIEINNSSDDFFFIPRNNSREIINNMKGLVLERLPRFLDVKPGDIQVLAPIKKTDLGVINLNKELQQAINPQAKDKLEKIRGEMIFREGDKVMQIKNNYRLEWRVCGSIKDMPVEEGAGVFNGDMGIVQEINEFEETLTVLFDDGRLAEYPYGMLDELAHAFAITIHKSQGSEYPAVIIPLLGGATKFYSRNLLYTAVTRAKNAVVIVGDCSMINKMIDNVNEMERYTGFCDKLKEHASGIIN